MQKPQKRSLFNFSGCYGEVALEYYANFNSAKHTLALDYMQLIQVHNCVQKQ